MTPRNCIPSLGFLTRKVFSDSSLSLYSGVELVTDRLMVLCSTPELTVRTNVSRSTIFTLLLKARTEEHCGSRIEIADDGQAFAPQTRLAQCSL